jgi:hypothetical protein
VEERLVISHRRVPTIYPPGSDSNHPRAAISRHRRCAVAGGKLVRRAISAAVSRLSAAEKASSTLSNRSSRDSPVGEFAIGTTLCHRVVVLPVCYESTTAAER